MCDGLLLAVFSRGKDREGGLASDRQTEPLHFCFHAKRLKTFHLLFVCAASSSLALRLLLLFFVSFLIWFLFFRARVCVCVCCFGVLCFFFLYFWGKRKVCILNISTSEMERCSARRTVNV